MRWFIFILYVHFFTAKEATTTAAAAAAASAEGTKPFFSCLMNADSETLVTSFNTMFICGYANCKINCLIENCIENNNNGKSIGTVLLLSMEEDRAGVRMDGENKQDCMILLAIIDDNGKFMLCYCTQCSAFYNAFVYPLPMLECVSLFTLRLMFIFIGKSW